MTAQKRNENASAPQAKIEQLPKTATGIVGLDEILEGGLPKERPTLVCGGAGHGKTLLAMEFVVRGAVQYGEPGVFVSFEETPEELTQNVASLGWDLSDLSARKRISLLPMYVERSDYEVSGEYDLEGLFVRLGHAIDTIGAKRVALDTVDVLFAGLPDAYIVRAELRRLCLWLKTKGVTAIVTAEPGETTLSRHGLEEYVADCVILLDHQVDDQISTRRMRVVKYRGSKHGTSEFPFLIDEHGLSVLPITTFRLEHAAPTERISTGIARLDAMFGGRGYFRGSSVLVSGEPGTGKTSVAASFVNAACQRGERCLYFSLEESPDQLIRNMRSVNLDLEPWVKQGLLRMYAARPTLYGLEMRLVTMFKWMNEFDPAVVVVDPITGLGPVGSLAEIMSMLTRLIDFLKAKGISVLFTSLTPGGADPESSEAGVSSLMDTWLTLQNIESRGEYNRIIRILKSRGMAHSNQIREFRLTDHGIELADVFVGEGGVLTGVARREEQARYEIELRRRQLAIKEKERELETAQAELEVLQREAELRRMARIARAEMRGEDADPTG